MTKPLYDIAPISNFREMMDNSALNFGNKNAFLYKTPDGVVSVTYERLRRSINILGTAMLAHGLKDEKVIICGENSYKWCLTYLSVTCGVGVIVPMDNQLPADEAGNILKESRAKAVFADKRTLNKLLSGAQIRKGTIIVCFEEPEPNSGILSFDKLLDEGEKLLSQGKNSYLNADIDPDALGILLFTSGTTGMAKGVMLSQRNICNDITSAMSLIRVTSSDVELNILPLYHAYESLVFLAVMNAGGCVAFSGGIHHLAEGMKEFRPTFVCAVPLIIEKLHAKITGGSAAKKAAMSLGRTAATLTSRAGINVEKKLFSKIHEALGGRLRFIITGAAAVNPRVAEDFASFGIPIIIGYGLTECSPIAICNSDVEHLPDSIGRPLPGSHARIDKPNEEGVGEICIKGPIVMLGYYEDKQATAAVMRDGWFHTGDLGYCDDKGCYHITGRAKNVIVTKTGKNIYPEELEHYLESSTAIAEVMVYGKDGANGTQVAADIYPDTDAISKSLGSDTATMKQIYAAVAQAVKGVNKRLPGYKSISTFTVRQTEFPKTTTKKIKRGQVRENDSGRNV